MTALNAAALLFDMDGTLLDSTHAVISSWHRMAERYRLDVDEVLAVIHGVRAADTIARFLPESERLGAFEWLEEVESTTLDGVVPIPGAVELLTRLNELGAPWAIVTSATPRLARARLAAGGLPVPEMLVTTDQVALGKPAPDGYLRAADLLQVSATDCVVVEDVPAGIQAGRAAGATVVVRGEHGGDDAEGLIQIADYRATRIDWVDTPAGPRIIGHWT